jgi:hypothetical protein
MKLFGLSLFLLNLLAAVYLLPVEAQSVAEQPVKQIQLLDLSAPHMDALLRLIEVEYSMRLGTGPYISFPDDTTVIVLSGELGKIYVDGCGCLGQVWNFAPHTAIVIADSERADPEEVLVHELIHVLQAADGRIFNRMPSDLAEHEAYLIGGHIVDTLNLLRDHRGL